MNDGSANPPGDPPGDTPGKSRAGTGNTTPRTGKGTAKGRRQPTHIAPGSASPRPRGAGALAAKPGYEVGYGKPPETTRFRKGVSGNPQGRPKGTKNRLPALNEERMKLIILEEAYRTIKVRDGERNVSVPIARAILRSLAVNAVKGQHRAQRLFAELLASVESGNKALHDEWLNTAMDYKIEWERELDRRRVLGITHLPDPLPHPDNIKIDLRHGTARVVGPATRDEKIQWDALIARKDDFEEEIRELSELLEVETDPALRDVYANELDQSRKIVTFLDRAKNGDL